MRREALGAREEIPGRPQVIARRRIYRFGVRFRLSGIPVRVRWSFWLVALLVVPLPYRLVLRPRAWPFLIAWLVVVFVTVLLHEHAHANAARRRGAEASITLYFLGGFTTWTTDGVRPDGRFWIAAAGSTAGFVLGGAVWLAFRIGLVPAGPPVVVFALENLWYVNLVWGALNWIPIRPLDGGQMLASGLEAWLGRTGTSIANVVLPSVTLIGGVLAFATGLYAVAVFAGLVLVAEVARLFGVGQLGSTTPVTDSADDQSVG
jgi:Zn-dependent protease